MTNWRLLPPNCRKSPPSMRYPANWPDTYSGLVPLPRPDISPAPRFFASKNGMIGIWSWDHAFHSLALANGHPDLAWAADHGDFRPAGRERRAADLVNDRLLSWSFCKPPVHGWILSRLMKNSALLTGERLREIYPRLARWDGVVVRLPRQRRGWHPAVQSRQRWRLGQQHGVCPSTPR